MKCWHFIYKDSESESGQFSIRYIKYDNTIRHFWGQAKRNACDRCTYELFSLVQV